MARIVGVPFAGGPAADCRFPPTGPGGTRSRLAAGDPGGLPDVFLPGRACGEPRRPDRIRRAATAIPEISPLARERSTDFTARPLAGGDRQTERLTNVFTIYRNQRKDP